jgi:hypothetical protein
VRATRWKPGTVSSAGTDLSISAERSVIGDTLDFLELSIAAKLDAAESEQAALEDFVGSHGCSPTPARRPGTRRVLEHLVRAT